MIRSTQGIILKAMDYRETSKICIFFTRDFGKIKGVLKAIRRDPKKYGSSAEKFSLNDIVFYWHANADIHLIGQCDLVDYFFAVRQEYKRLLAANYMTELVNKLMPVEEPNKEVFQLILQYMESLKTINDINKLVHIFQVKILYLSGFRPHLDSCVHCKRQVKQKAWFSIQRGGLLCDSCGASDTTASRISNGAVASILHIERSRWPYALRLGLSASVKRELKYVLNNFLVYHLERPIKSARFL